MACIGIDLGTTNSLVAVYQNSQPNIIPNALGKRMTPSVVGLDDDGSLLVGQPARERLTSHPDRTVSMFKPNMGTKKQYTLGEQTYSVVELSAIVLKALREDAEHFLQGEPITHVIISVPAYFNNNQRNAVKAAAAIAGLNAQRVISEPTAAALSYGMEKADFESLFLVLDLGGGTFDVSLMEQFDGIFDIKASAGNNRLGGEDFLDSLVNRFLAHHNLSPTQLSSSELESIRRQCENIKRDLTHSDEVRTPIRLKDNVYTFFCSNSNFADIAQPLLAQFKEPIVRVLKDTQTGISNIDYLVLVGGASRMPVFKNLIRQYFPTSEILIHDPDEAVVKGACIQSWLDANESEIVEYVVTDVCPYTLGIDVYRTAYEKDVYLPIIERNCPIPVSKTTTVYKHTAEQQHVHIEIYQGESLDPKRNTALGKLIIPTPWHDTDVPIQVQLTYDYNGIIQADVMVKSHNIHKSILLQNADALLTNEEIEGLRQRMAELSVLPRDKAENRLRIAKLERLYEETLGAERQQISILLSNFHHALKSQDKLLLVKTTKSIDMYLEEYQFDSQPAR